MTDHVAEGPIEAPRPRPRPADPAVEAPPAPAQLTRESAPLDLPDRRVFWGWVWAHVRPVVGWVLAALGALALFLGWYGVSGQALTAKQIPYLVSGGLVGIGLIVMAGVFLATDDWRRQVTRLAILERKVDDLLALLTTDEPVNLLPPAPEGTSPRLESVSGTVPRRTSPRADGHARHEPVVALATGTVFHRPDCALVAGKPAAPVDAATAAERNLAPCRVCDPPAPAA